MIKKSIFVILAMFGFHSVADMHEGSDHMSDMMSSSSSDVEETGFAGAVELKSHVLDDLRSSYRLHMGWKGDVNEHIRWGASVSSGFEQSFGTAQMFENFGLTEAYVAYMPVEGLHFKAGRYNWKPNFHKTGVLYDDDIYAGGFAVKYHQGAKDNTHFFVKAVLYNLDPHPFGLGHPILKMTTEEANEQTEAASSEEVTPPSPYGPYTNDTLLKVKAGGHYAMSEDMMGGAYVSVEYDGLFKAEDNKAEDKMLAQAGLNFTVSSMAVPVGFFGVYVTDINNMGDNHSFNAGVFVGKASTPQASEANDFGVALSYYDVNEADHNTNLMDTDYVRQGTGKGIAARVQYNVWDNTNVVAKYVHDLTSGVKEDDKNRLVAELTFNF